MVMFLPICAGNSRHKFMNLTSIRIVGKFCAERTDRFSCKAEPDHKNEKSLKATDVDTSVGAYGEISNNDWQIPVR